MLEEAWLGASGEQRTFLQGLIQMDAEYSTAAGTATAATSECHGSKKWKKEICRTRAGAGSSAGTYC